MYTNWAREDALAVLEANYPTQDPPLYTGTQPWVSIALAKDGADPDLLLAANAPESDSRDSKKAKKRKRVHAVYGRVTCVSPISQQVDRANCHFFVEVEHVHTDGHSTTQSVVNVMFTGAQSMQWHLFLRPGKFVLLSDLTKVFSRECGLFLLQTTNVEQPSATPAIAKAPLKTIVLIWDAVRLPSPRLSVASWVGDSFDTYSQHEASRCCGKLMDYEGRVSKLLWDDCVEIRGPDDANVLICLFHFPFVDGLVRLREGATVQIRLAHVLRWPTPIGGKLVLGLCPRSHFTITAYGGATSPCVVVGTRPRQGHSSKKWAQLGDFRRQSMILSMWLLESLELLAKKFSFGSDAQVRCGPSLMTFPRVRRREAVARVAKTLGFALASDREKTATTLGALFLNCHSHDTMNCVAIQMELAEKRLASTRVVTIRELQKFGEGVLSQMTTQTASGSREATRLLSLRISRDELDWCLLIGCIRGSLESGDLEICDRTGSIPLHLDGRKDGEALTRLHGGRCIYLIHGFELSVEDFNAVENLKGRDESFPLAYCVSGSASDVTCIAMNGEEDINWSPEGNLLAIAPGERQLLVLVTNWRVEKPLSFQ
ncbi:hypothetical protein BBJ28_00020506 [Nothophytophthora sp. Chile5]|nr:hypothetical protein BBJ28_00020506 [Nothophytophthora sp. Chile5]